MNRLSNLPTMRIDLSEKLSLTYQGKNYLGRPAIRQQLLSMPTVSGFLDAVLNIIASGGFTASTVNAAIPAWKLTASPTCEPRAPCSKTKCK